MTVPIRPLPPEADHAWYLHYQDIDLAVRELQALVTALSPPSGFIATINGTLTPDVSGNVNIGASDVNAMSSGYTPGLGDLPLGFGLWVFKDPITLKWPGAWNLDGSPDYTTGSTNHGRRPHTRLSTVVWVGDYPDPDSVDSGDGGMLRGYDQRAIPVP